MADEGGRHAEWPFDDGVPVSDEPGLEEGEFEFDWEPGEPESLWAQLMGRWDRFLASIPGTRPYWSRLQEVVEERVGWRLEAFQEMTSLSADQKQSLLPRVFAI